MVRPSTRITVLASLCLLVVGTASSLGSGVAVANPNTKEGCGRENGATRNMVLMTQLRHQGISGTDSVSTIDSLSSGRCQNERRTNSCVINIGNTQRVGAKVQSTTSIDCNDPVPLIHVQSWVTRSDADFVVQSVRSDSSTCRDARHCAATAKLDWKDNPNDWWHGWGNGRVEYDNQGGQQDKCQFKGSRTAFGVTGLFRSEECRQHNRCTAL